MACLQCLHLSDVTGYLHKVSHGEFIIRKHTSRRKGERRRAIGARDLLQTDRIECPTTRKGVRRERTGGSEKGESGRERKGREREGEKRRGKGKETGELEVGCKKSGHIHSNRFLLGYCTTMS